MQITHILATVQDEFMTLLISVILDTSIFDVEVIVPVQFMFLPVNIDQSLYDLIHCLVQSKSKG